MPPKRPAAALPAVRAKAKAKAKVKAAAKPKPKAKALAKGKAKAKAGGLRNRLSRQRRRAKGGTPPPAPAEEWKEAGAIGPGDLGPGSTALLRAVYGTDTGEICGQITDRVQDQEGTWVGVKVLGTTISSLRQWVLTHPGVTFYVGLGEMADPGSLKETGVGTSWLSE